MNLFNHNVAVAASEPRVQWYNPATWQSPRDARKLFAWTFAFASLSRLIRVLVIIPYAIRYHYAALPTFSIVVAAVCGIAWWDVWKDRPSAKGWAVAVGLIFVLSFLRQFLIPVRLWDHGLTSLVSGIGVLIIFLSPGGKRTAPADSEVLK